MEGGAHELFPSATDLSNSMPYQLSWSTPSISSEHWIFWSDKDDELRGLLGSLDPSVDISASGNRTIAEKIKAFLRSMRYIFPTNDLIQFWAPVQIGEQVCLTTASQPFVLGRLLKGFCSYRKLCLSNVVHVNALADEEKQNHGPIARVFRRGIHEQCHPSLYRNEEYPLRDYAVQLGVEAYEVLPLFEGDGKQCIGVLEILSTTFYLRLGTLAVVILERIGLMTSSASLRSNADIDPLGEVRASELMKDICRSHQLDFAQMWTGNSTSKCIVRRFGYQKPPINRAAFNDDFSVRHLWEGEGVAGKAFASRNACFCDNVSELSISLNPSALTARKYGLTGCFAVCLRSTQVDFFFILEFFSTLNGEGYTDPRSFANMLVASLKRKIQTSRDPPFQNLDDRLFVEVIKTAPNDELGSFEIRDATQITTGNRIGFENFSEVRSNSPFSNPEVGLGRHLSLGPRINGVRCYSDAHSSYSLSSVQGMNFDIRLGPPDGFRNYSMVQANSPFRSRKMRESMRSGPLEGIRNYSFVQPNSPSSVQEMSLGLHLGFDHPRLEAEEDDSTSSCSVANYRVVRQRLSSPDKSTAISNSDSDFADIHAFTQILRGGRI